MENIDIIVIGAGIAGCSAAFYLKRANVNFIMLDGDKVGGKLHELERIENYPTLKKASGKEIAKMLEEQLQYLDVDLRKENVQTILKIEEGFEVKTDRESYKSKVVIVATGNSKISKEIPGEETYFGQGVSYCATCDGNFFKMQDVAVVGNGTGVLEEALYLANLASKVLLFIPNKINGENSLVEDILSNSKIQVFENAKVEEILGNEFGVSNIKVDGKLYDVAGVFPYVGKKSSTQILNNLNPLKNGDYIIVNESMMSNIKGLYVAGDLVNKKLRQLITAASDGAIAATSAISFIR